MGGGGGGGGIHGTIGSISSDWSRGNTNSSRNNAEKHYKKHKSEVGAKNLQDYLRKAYAYKETILNKKKKGRLISGYTFNVYRYKYNGKYIDLQKLSDGTYKIVSFGKQ